MTGVTRWNKSTTPAGGDGWSLTPNIGTALDTANVVVPVASASERNALLPPGGKYAGMAVSRQDLGGLIEVLGQDLVTWNSPVKRRRAAFDGTSDGTTGANAPWQFNVLTKDTLNSFNDSFVTASASKSRITFAEAGIYDVHLKVASTANPGISFASIKDSSNSYVHADNSNGNGTVWGITVPLPGLYIPAGGTDILFGLQTGNAVTAAQLTVRIIVTKKQD